MMYRDDLDNLQCACGVPACEDPVILHSKCHYDAPTWVEYFDGKLTVRCSTCEAVVAEVAVARKFGGNHG